jgi:hypothetical protein
MKTQKSYQNWVRERSVPSDLQSVHNAGNHTRQRLSPLTAESPMMFVHLHLLSQNTVAKNRFKSYISVNIITNGYFSFGSTLIITSVA